MATVEVNKAILQTVLVLARELEENMRKKKQRKKRTLWVRHWISRRGRLGASNNLLRELKLEEPTDYKNFLRMNGQQFDQLLEKVMAGRTICLYRSNLLLRDNLLPFAISG